MCQGGQLGGILGSIGGGLLDVAFPEIGIPLSLAAGLGGFGGTLLGDVASGKSLGQSIVPALETGGISGALAGVGNIAAGGDFFGAPTASLSGIFGGAAPTAADTAGAAATGAAATPAATLASTAPATAGIGTGTAVGAPAAGGGALGGDVATALGPATGSAPGGVNLAGSAIGGGAPPSAAAPPWGADFASRLTGGGLTGGGEALNAGNTVPLGTPLTAANAGFAPSGVSIPGVDTAGVTDIGGQVPGVSGGGSSGGSLWSRLFGGGGGTAAPTTVTDAAGNVTSIAGGGGTSGGGSFLSRGLVGNQGSLISDLTKPTTLLTGGAALLPLLQGNTIPGLSDLQNQAKTLNAQGTPLAQSLQTGNLPAGEQSSLDAATRSAAAQVRSRYAAMGLSGSSQEADQLAGVEATAATHKVAMLEDLTGIGLKEMGMASPILQQIMQTQLAQSAQQQQNLQRLAAALAGSTGTEKTAA